MNPDFKRRLAEKNQDNRLLSPKEVAEWFIEDINNGVIKPDSVAIHFIENCDDDIQRPGYYLSNLDFNEHVALLEMAKVLRVHDRIK